MGKKIKIACLSSYTIKNIKPFLSKSLLENGFSANLKFGGYNQINQELLDINSWLYDFKPEIIFISLSVKTFFPNLEYEILENTNLFEEYKVKILDLINSISNCNLNSKIILTTFETPIYSPFSLMDIKLENGILNFIKKCNSILIKSSNDNPNLVLLDFERVCSIVGKKNYIDDKLYYLGKILLTNSAVIELSKEVVNIINSSYGNIKKCLVIDLDNTLWGGVIGEDGIEKLKLGNSTIGDIYSEIQKLILNFKKLGILLVIVSKNNLEDVLPIFNEDKMILKKNDFVSMRINWEKKSENIISISKELNIGLDSMVFLDDNPSERLEVESNLPMVSIINFPIDISLLPKVLREMDYFNFLSLTNEDKKRNKMYLENKERKNILENKNSKGSIENYLSKLEIQITIKINDLKNIERITQLINKTNQFNLRTIRYSKEEVISMMNDNNFQIFSLEVSDKFGDLGLTGVAIIHKVDNYYFIDNFLMSCRILSRNIEFKFFNEIFKYLKNKNQLDFKSEYLKSPKNSLTSKFYDNLGLKKDKVLDKGSCVTYKLNTKEFKLKSINYIKLKNG